MKHIFQLLFFAQVFSLLLLYQKVHKGILMQIWKFLYVLGFI